MSPNECDTLQNLVAYDTILSDQCELIDTAAMEPPDDGPQH